MPSYPPTLIIATHYIFLSCLSCLKIVQNAAARVLTRSQKREHITSILATLHWLPVSYRIDFKILIFVFKVLNSFAPSYIKELLPSYHTLSDQRLLSVPRSRTQCYEDRTFSIAAPQLWNYLPPPIRFSLTIKIIKSHFKTQL